MAGGIFTTKNLSAGYGKKIIIGGAEISAQRGEITTLIGPNGCGKSTLLKTAAKQLAPMGGAVFIGGRDVSETNPRELAKKLSILFTQRVSTELMTCRDVVESGRYPYTGQLGILSDEDNGAVEEAMALTSTQELSGVDFSRISDGQRQRVLLAMAICRRPEMMILDEPTSYLDIRHKLELLNTLKRLVREKNIAVLMSLHELDLAERVSDKIICIDGGKVGRVGTPEEIFGGGYIAALYGIGAECFCEISGCAELERPSGKPRVFVISGGGHSSALFRRLQRRGVPFAAGVIAENDIDLPTARALAAEVLTRRAFGGADEETLRRGRELIGECGSVVCCEGSFGGTNEENSELWAYAEERGMLRSAEEFFGEIE